MEKSKNVIKKDKLKNMVQNRQKGTGTKSKKEVKKPKEIKEENKLDESKTLKEFSEEVINKENIDNINNSFHEVNNFDVYNSNYNNLDNFNTFDNKENKQDKKLEEDKKEKLEEDKKEKLEALKDNKVDSKKNNKNNKKENKKVEQKANKKALKEEQKVNKENKKKTKKEKTKKIKKDNSENINEKEKVNENINANVVTTKKREIGLDILRILAMMMIVTLHTLCFGKGLSLSQGRYFNFVWLIEIFCLVAANVYVLISGYFLVKSKFKIKKFIGLWIETLLYSIIPLVIYKSMNGDLNLYDTLVMCSPVLNKTYWFMTMYLVLYALSPFLNKMINALDKKQLRNLMLMAIFTFSIVPTFVFDTNPIDATGGYGIIWFVTLYIIAAYMRLYVNLDKFKRFIPLVSYIGMSVLTTYIYLTCIRKIPDTNQFSYIYKRIINYNSPLMLFSTVSLFTFFKNINIRSKSLSKIINIVAVSTLGVYLFHENLVMRKLLYTDVFHIDKYINTRSYPIEILRCVILIFMAGVIIDLIRRIIVKLLGKIWNGLKKYRKYRLSRNINRRNTIKTL